MKINWRKLFTLFVTDSAYFEDTTDKIECVGCSVTYRSCMDYLPAINDYFRKSERYQRIKDYDRAIDALESAYYKAGELNKADCFRCTLFFQATIIQALENVYLELEKMSKGIFKTKRYQASLVKAEELLKRIKDTKTLRPAYQNSRKNQSLIPIYT